MLNDLQKNSTIPTAWVAVIMDETSLYGIDEADRPFIKRILGVKMYDENTLTYCCSATPAYYVIPLYDTVEVVGGCPDDKREELQEKYEHHPSNPKYFECRDIDSISEEGKKRAPLGEEEDDVRENWQSNCPF